MGAEIVTWKVKIGDIILQNAAALASEWQMDGDHVLLNQNLGSLSTDWHML